MASWQDYHENSLFCLQKYKQNSLLNLNLLYFQARGYLFVPHRVLKLACKDVLLYRLEVFHLFFHSQLPVKLHGSFKLIWFQPMVLLVLPPDLFLFSHTYFLCPIESEHTMDFIMNLHHYGFTWDMYVHCINDMIFKFFQEIIHIICSKLL